MNRRVQVLGALALALAIAAWWGRPQPVDRRAELDWGLPALAEVTDITLTRTGQPEVRLVHGEAGWQVMPAGAPADEYAVADLQAALATPVGVDQAQPRATAALDDFGLGEHALHVRLGRRVDKPLAFRVGKLVDGRRTFVLPDEGDHLYRARVDLRRAFDRPAAEWRERRLFAHAYGEVAALQATRGEQLEWRARRVDAQTPWRFEVPADRVAGQQELDGVANSLATARAVAFEDDPAAPFSPRLRVQAETFDGAFFGLDLEAPAPDGSARVRRVAGGPIARLPRHLVLFLDVKPDDLRERRLIGCAPEKVEAVVIAGEVPLRVERTQEGAWKMAAPQAISPLPPGPIGVFIDGLCGLRTAGFPAQVPPDAFARIEHRVDLRLANDQSVTLEIGAEYTPGARFVRSSARAEQVFVLPAPALKALRPVADDFLEK